MFAYIYGIYLFMGESQVHRYKYVEANLSIYVYLQMFLCMHFAHISWNGYMY